MKRASPSRGSSTVELIVVLPTLFLVLFGIVELSRAWLTLNLATTAVREGARAGAVARAEQFPNPPSAVQRINDILGTGKWTGDVTCSTAPCASDSEVQATVTVTFHTVMPIILPMLRSLAIKQTARMRYE